MDFTVQEINVIRQAHMDNDELYHHAMGPVAHLINDQNNYMQMSQYHPYPSLATDGSLPQQQLYPQVHQQQPFYYHPTDPSQHFPQHPSHLPNQFAELEHRAGHFDQPAQYDEYQQLHGVVLSKDDSSSSQDYHNQPHAFDSQSSTLDHLSISEYSHPIQIESSMAPVVQGSLQQQLQQLPTTAESTATPMSTSSMSSYSAKNSPYNVNDDSDRSKSIDLYTKNLKSPSAVVQSKSGTNTGNDGKEGVEIPLIRHQLNKPQFDLAKFPEFFDETIPNAFARVFLLKEVHTRLMLATKTKTLFYGMLLQGLGKLSVTLPELEGLFLKYRGFCMNTVRNQLSDITDSNAEQLLMLTSILNSSSIYIKTITMKDFFSLASGPAVLLRTAFEDPSRFQKSFIKLKNHADGLLFTARSVWNPRYNHKSLFELLDVIKEFGAKYIDDEDQYNDDDLIKSQYADLVDYIEFALNFLEGDQSNKHVLLYPVDKIYKLVQLWYQRVPSQIYTFGSETPAVEKVFYVFWFVLGELLEDIIVGGRYIFTFLFNGFYLLYPFNKSQLYENFQDEELKQYANYLCRIIAFLNRRKAYIVRNTVLNDPIPAFFDTVDRFKPRSLDIHERCITSFKNTKIKPYHYPSESTTSGNLTSGTNYYKAQNDLNDQTDSATQLLNNLSASLADESSEEAQKDLDLSNINSATGLLDDDYDPRFSDPIFQTNVVFQSADLNFLNQYHEDRKLIIQLDMEE